MADHQDTGGIGGGRTLQCSVVTPEATVLETAAGFVALPLYDGEIGIAPGHSPFIGRLGYGELRTRRGAETRRYYVDGGFSQVRANVVTVLTPQAVRAEDIDPAAASQALEAARAPGATPEAQAAQLKAQDRARAQLRLARRARGEAPA